MRCSRRPRRLRGLTLVELLVAISVLGFVAVLGWRGLDSITRARTGLNAELEQTRGMQLAFAQLQTDCANAVEPSVLDGRAPLAIDATRVSLVRRVQPEGQAGALQVVTWRLRDGVLSREESPPTRDLTQLDQYWQFAQAGGAQAVPLEGGLQSMQMRVWTDDGGGWRGAEQTSSNNIVSRGAMMNPRGGNTAMQVTWRGLEVSLQMPGRPAPMTKIFMLGAI
jgi:general secretion pathway protein J